MALPIYLGHCWGHLEGWELSLSSWCHTIQESNLSLFIWQFSRPLKAQAQKSQNITYTVFYWSKQDTGLAQIQREGEIAAFEYKKPYVRTGMGGVMGAMFLDHFLQGSKDGPMRELNWPTEPRPGIEADQNQKPVNQLLVSQQWTFS